MSLLASISASSMVNRQFKKMDFTMVTGSVATRNNSYDKFGTFTYVGAVGYADSIPIAEWNNPPMGSFSSTAFRGMTIKNFLEEHGTGYSNNDFSILATSRVINEFTMKLEVASGVNPLTLFEKVQVFSGSTLVVELLSSAAIVDVPIETIRHVRWATTAAYKLVSGSTYTVRFVYKS